MEKNEITLKAKLLATSCDTQGYRNYVFENLDTTDINDKYVMCVRFPNWKQGVINIDEEGFVTVKYVQAGVDTWCDRTGCEHKYNYSNIIFLKFIALPTNTPEKILLD